MPVFAHVNVKNSFLHTFSVTDGKKFAFAVFGFRNKVDLTGPARIADHRDAKKNRGEARPSSARIFVPRVRTSTPAREMPIFAHVNEESSFLHTLSVTDGKNSFFAHVLGYGRKKIDGLPPPRPRK